MQFKQIGNTKVPAIGQGTGKVYDENIIRRGIELGMTFIDTAESYGNEDVVGRAIKGQRDKVFISTKFSPEHNGYEDVIKACEGSLRRLGIDYIDLYSMYYPNPNFDEESTAAALSALLEQGEIRYIGICNSSKVAIGQLKVQGIQREYNLFDRSVEKTILPYCEQNDILTIAYKPLEDWDLLNPNAMAWLQEITFKYQRTVKQVVLNWLISHKSVIVIPRSNNPKHIIENSQASDFLLSLEDIAEIDKLFPFEPSYLDPKLINIALSADKYPQTKEQAMAWDKWAVKPQDIDLTGFKPVRVAPTWEGTYEILEGAIRYWAWVIQKNEPIPAIIKKRWILQQP